MVLFLTSSPCDDNVPEGVKLPCIWDVRNEFVDNMAQCWPENANLLIIAAAPESYDLNDEMFETFVNCFKYHDFPLEDAVLLDARNMADASELVPRSNVIILGGGHVPTEIEFFREMGLRELLEETFDGIIMGISAGSMNCAEVVYAQPELPGESLDPNYERFITGLGLTEVNVLPHYQKAKYYDLDGRKLYEHIVFEDSFGNSFLCLPDGSYVLETEEERLVFGEAYLIENGDIRQICEEGGCVAI